MKITSMGLTTKYADADNETGHLTETTITEILIQFKKVF